MSDNIQFKTALSGLMTADELRRLYVALDRTDEPFDLHVSKKHGTKGHWLVVLRCNEVYPTFDNIWIFAKYGEL